MNKKWKFASFVLTCALFCGVAGTTFVGCKDYDDDIDRIDKELAAQKADIEKIQSLINSGQWVKSVEPIENGVRITMGDGKTTFDIKNGTNGAAGQDGQAGKDGTVITIKDGYWVIDGVKSDVKAQGEDGINGLTPEIKEGYWWIGEKNTGVKAEGTDGDNGLTPEIKEGYWWIGTTNTGVKAAGTDGINGTTPTPYRASDKQFTGNWWIGEEETDIPCVAGLGMYVVDNEEAATVTLHILKQGSTTEYDDVVFPKQAINYVTSLTYIPTNMDKDLGEVAFFPIITTDENSEGVAVYEYNLTKKAFATTHYEGWLGMDFQVNPANLNEDKFMVKDFDVHAVYAKAIADTRAANGEATLPAVKTNYKNGVLSVKAQGLIMSRYERNEFDDPDGIEIDDEYVAEGMTKVDQLALRVQNLNDGNKLVNDGVVTSDYVTAKRMVVLQKDVTIGLNVNRVQEALTKGNWRPLTTLYTAAQFAGDNGQAIKAAAPVLLDVTFEYGINLSDVLVTYAKKINTNTAYHKEGQFTLEQLGFGKLGEDYILSYDYDGYDAAQVDQTMRYLKLNKVTGEIKFDQTQTSAIDREPVIKVFLKTKDGKALMTQLLKIKVVHNFQTAGTPTVDDLKNVVLGCKDLDGMDIKGMYIDMDKVFDYAGMGKDRFVNTYITLAKDGSPKYTITKDGAPYTGTDVVFNTNLFTTATTGINRLPVTVKKTAQKGTYKIKAIYETKDTECKYKSITFEDEFVLSYPETSLTYNPNMWDGTKNMVIYGVPTTGDYGAPLIMSGLLENGFNKYAASNCPEAASKLHFVLVNPDQYKNTTDGTYEVTIAYDATTGKHALKITKEAYRKWVNRDIKVRAYSYFNEDWDATKADFVPARMEECPINAPIVNAAPNVGVFNVRFVDPVSYQDATNADWFLLDKAPSDAAYGYEVPVYRNFRLYDTQKGLTNGIIWEPTQYKGWWVKPGDIGEIGTGLRDLHNVKIEYMIKVDKNTPFVLANAVIDGVKAPYSAATGYSDAVSTNNYGVLSWNNSGEAVVEPQPIVVTVVLTYNWCPTVKVEYDVTIYVKAADTAWPDPQPSVGIISRGTSY